MSEKQRTPVAVENLRRIWNLKRSEMKITQAQAAKELGWTQGAFSQYLNNITALSPATVIKFANFLGVAPTEIDPDIHDNLPYLVKKDIRFASSDPEKRIRKTDVYHETSLPFFYILANEPIKNAEWLPTGTLIRCLPSDVKPVVKNAEVKDSYFLVLRKDANKFEYLSENQCPPKSKLKYKWLVHGFTIY